MGGGGKGRGWYDMWDMRGGGVGPVFHISPDEVYTFHLRALPEGSAWFGI